MTLTYGDGYRTRADRRAKKFPVLWGGWLEGTVNKRMWSQVKSIRSLSAVLRNVTFCRKVVGSPDDSCGAGVTSSEAHFGGMVPRTL